MRKLKTFLAELRANTPKPRSFGFGDCLKIVLFDHGRRIPHFLSHLINVFDIGHPVRAKLLRDGLLSLGDVLPLGVVG